MWSPVICDIMGYSDPFVGIWVLAHQALSHRDFVAFVLRSGCCNGYGHAYKCNQMRCITCKPVSPGM